MSHSKHRQQLKVQIVFSEEARAVENLFEVVKYVYEEAERTKPN